MVPALVSIRSIAVRSFDTEMRRTSQASGFVVDSKLGIILTNRHVVQPGPTLSEAIFTQSKEEVKLIPIYRDPVHDFGFFKFDPNHVNYMSIREIPLRPSNARLGLDIRVVGNDAGERLSILSGTLARLDRQAPNYGQGKYNDFNTFYFQASSMTSGGSSGSPVIDIDGNAIALNAGGATKAASSFFLPLDRVLRALILIRSGELISRGTLQSIFSFTHFDELRRLGLNSETESVMRRDFPESTGMLIAKQVMKGGQAHGILEPGDILLKVNGVSINAFIPFESVMDNNIGKNVSLTLQRSLKTLDVVIKPRDLDSITPNRYFECNRYIN